MMKNLLPLLAALAAFPALAADEPAGMAKPWQLGFQEAATPVMEKLVWLHDTLLLNIIAAITAFVLLLTLFIILRFNRRVNPVPSKTAHNTVLEIVWTVVPIIILGVIIVPSLRTHYFMQRPPEEGITVKAVGHQWYWSYEYPDQGNFGFDSYLIKDEDLKPGQHRLLEVDNALVVPVDTVVTMQLTGADVIHAWAMPAFGVKKDAVPGRLNETWFKATKTGTFYGQCSELCGVGHGFMPIRVDVVSQEDFDAWTRAKQKEAGLPVTGAAKSTQPVAIPPVEPAVAPGSKEEPKPKDNAPQAPASAKPAEKVPVKAKSAPAQAESEEDKESE